MLLAAALTAVLALGLGAWAALRTARDQPVVFRQLVAAGVVEIALLVQVVIGVVASASGDGPAEPWTFWGYLVVALLVLPGAALWALVERTRWSSVVLLVGSLTIAVMELRMAQVWIQGTVG